MLPDESTESGIVSEDSGEFGARSSSATPVRYIVWAAVAIAFTCFVIQYSFLHNRLAYFPVQDDITYIADGLDRLNFFYVAGVPGSVYYYRTLPPHNSPAGTYMAALGFALFGFKDWAPYASNAIFVFILLWCIDVLMQGTKLRHKIAATVFVLCCPAAILMVNEFRPDLGCGLVTAFGIITLLRKPFLWAPLQEKLASGAIFGAALFIKPSIFPGTIVFAGAALALAALRDLITAKGRPAWGVAVRSILVAFGAIAVVSMPYVYFARKTMWEYLAVNLLDTEHRKAWEIPGGLRVQLHYYLDGPGGAFLLGGYLYLFSWLLLAGAVGILLTRRKWPACTLVGAALMLGLTYLTPSLTPGKNTFGGATFTWLLVFCCLLLFKSALDHNRAVLRRVPWAAGFLFLGSLASLYGLHMPARWDEGGSTAKRIANQFGWDVFNTVMDKLDEAPLGKRRIFVTTYGTINYQLLHYLSIREDRLPHEVPMLLPPDRTDLKLYDDQMNKAELTLVSEAGNGTVAEMMPSASMQDQALALARSRADMVEIRRFPTANRKFFYLFEKKGAFVGWYRSEGMGRLDGPSPEQGLPEFRLGYGPSSRLFLASPVDGPLTMHFRCKSLVPQQHVVVNVDGRKAWSFDVGAQAGFKDFSHPLSLDIGDHVVELLYSDWQKKGSAPAAVQFTEIQLLPGTPLAPVRKAPVPKPAAAVAAK